MPNQTVDQPAADTNAGSAAHSIHSVLLLCARPAGDALAQDRIKAIAEFPFDWAGLLASAADNGMAPVVCRQLETAAGDALPLPWRERFRKEFARNARRNLILSAELFQILATLEAKGIAAVPYKGPVLAAQAYGDVALRPFADLDIVVPHRQIAETYFALASLGYSSDVDLTRTRDLRFITRGNFGQLALSGKDGMFNIELHTEKSLRYFPVPLDWERLLPRLYRVELGGGAVRTFSLEDTLCLISVHGTKHFWDRLGWILDVSKLAQLPDMDWSAVEQIARGMRCWKTVLLGLAVANQLLETRLPAAVADAIRGDSAVQGMARQVCLDFFRQPESSWGVLRRLRFRLQSHDTTAQGLRQCMRITTEPTEDDWKAVRLPRGLEPLYTFVRPLRLLRKHGLGVGRQLD